MNSKDEIFMLLLNNNVELFARQYEKKIKIAAVNVADMRANIMKILLLTYYLYIFCKGEKINLWWYSHFNEITDSSAIKMRMKDRYSYIDIDTQIRKKTRCGQMDFVCQCAIKYRNWACTLHTCFVEGGSLVLVFFERFLRSNSCNDGNNAIHLSKSMRFDTDRSEVTVTIYSSGLCVFLFTFE